MCNAYTLHSSLEALRRLFGASGVLNLPERIDAFPGRDAVVIRDGVVELAHWGFAPGWAKRPLTNAKSEDVKPTFAEAFRHRGRFGRRNAGCGLIGHRSALPNFGHFTVLNQFVDALARGQKRIFVELAVHTHGIGQHPQQQDRRAAPRQVFKHNPHLSCSSLSHPVQRSNFSLMTSLYSLSEIFTRKTK